jgi:hypothetical protein
VGGADTPPQIAGGVLYLIATGIPVPTGTPATQLQPISVVLALSTSDGSLKWDHTSDGVPGLPFFVAP